jgi:hypothetical protein
MEAELAYSRCIPGVTAAVLEDGMRLHPAGGTRTLTGIPKAEPEGPV